LLARADGLRRDGGHRGGSRVQKGWRRVIHLGFTAEVDASIDAVGAGRAAEEHRPQGALASAAAGSEDLERPGAPLHDGPVRCRASAHRGFVLALPWAEVVGTWIESAQHFARHFHQSYGVGLIERGAQHSASGRGPVRAYAGDVITVNPGEVHDGRPLGGATRRWRMVYLEPALLRSMASRPGGELSIARPVIPGDASLAMALRRLFRTLQAWSEGGAERMACDEALVRLCGELLERHATRAPAPQARAGLGRVRQRLVDDLRCAPSLAELAAIAGVSRFQLLRRFEEVHGAPPHAWLLAQRAERARAAIRAGTPLAQVAADCGFADQSHMTRVFARRYGVTPGAWRERAKEGPQ